MSPVKSLAVMYESEGGGPGARLSSPKLVFWSVFKISKRNMFVKFGDLN